MLSTILRTEKHSEERLVQLRWGLCSMWRLRMLCFSLCPSPPFLPLSPSLPCSSLLPYIHLLWYNHIPLLFIKPWTHTYCNENENYEDKKTDPGAKRSVEFARLLLWQAKMSGSPAHVGWGGGVTNVSIQIELHLRYCLLLSLSYPFSFKSHTIYFDHLVPTTFGNCI